MKSKTEQKDFTKLMHEEMDMMVCFCLRIKSVFKRLGASKRDKEKEEKYTICKSNKLSTHLIRKYILAARVVAQYT